MGFLVSGFLYPRIIPDYPIHTSRNYGTKQNYVTSTRIRTFDHLMLRIFLTFKLHNGSKYKCEIEKKKYV